MASAFKGRREDDRLVTGRGRYSDDWQLPGELYASFKRSDRAHARIVSLSVDAARQTPGVVAIVTGVDIAAAGFRTLPPIAPFAGTRRQEDSDPRTSAAGAGSRAPCRRGGGHGGRAIPRGRARRRRPDRGGIRGAAGHHRLREGAGRRRRCGSSQHSGQRVLRFRVRRRGQGRGVDPARAACRAPEGGEPARCADADGAARRARLVRRC